LKNREHISQRDVISQQDTFGQIERGDFLVSLSALDKIASATGVDLDYIVYGKGKNDKLKIKKALDNLINRSNKEELKMYYKCITTISNYISKT